MSTIRVIIITVPPAHVRSEIEPLRSALCRLAGDDQALAYPPHITLRTGAFVPREHIRVFVHKLWKTLDGMASFHVRADGLFFGQTRHQGETRHICAATFEPCHALFELHQRLLSFQACIKGPQHTFWPHLSLVYGNLTAEGLLSIRDYLDHHPDLRQPAWHWAIDHVALYCPDIGHWKRLHTLSFFP